MFHLTKYDVNSLSLSLILFPFFLYETIPNEIPKSFGAIGITVLVDEPVESFQ